MNNTSIPNVIRMLWSKEDYVAIGRYISDSIKNGNDRVEWACGVLEYMLDHSKSILGSGDEILDSLIQLKSSPANWNEGKAFFSALRYISNKLIEDSDPSPDSSVLIDIYSVGELVAKVMFNESLAASQWGRYDPDTAWWITACLKDYLVHCNINHDVCVFWEIIRY